MNIERLKNLRAILELAESNDGKLLLADDHEISFNMDNWYHEDSCGTAACGLGMYVLATPEIHFQRYDSIFMRVIYNEIAMRPIKFACEHFDISPHTASRLFMPDEYEDEMIASGRDYDPYRIEISDVIKRIDLLLETES